MAEIVMRCYGCHKDYGEAATYCEKCRKRLIKTLRHENVSEPLVTLKELPKPTGPKENGTFKHGRIKNDEV